MVVALELSIVGGVDGNVGKSSSSRPGGFGCSGVKLFLKDSDGLDLYVLLDSGSIGSESDGNTCCCCNGGANGGIDEVPSLVIGAMSEGGGVRTFDVPGDVNKDDDDGAETLGDIAANSSSAFLIRS